MKSLTNVVLLWESYLRDQASLSKHTLLAYKNDLNNFLQFLSSYLGHQASLQDVLQADIRTFRSWLASRVKSKKAAVSSARAISSLRNFYSFLIDRAYLNSSQIFSIRSPKKPYSTPKALEKSEAFLCLEEIGKNNGSWIEIRDKTLLLLLYATGLRISEALSVTKSHLGGEFLRIKGKGSKERIVPMLQILKDQLRFYLKCIPFTLESNQPIFVGKFGKTLQASAFRFILAKLRAKFGLPKYTTPHAFRHSFATHLLSNQVSLRAVQELLGHASLSSTQIYTKVDLEHLQKAYEAHPMCQKPDLG